ncbi:hypothetical protein MLD52_06085 [Puniceicoccaceae bacterium K14]|nr:hypothetical protein [Puniceicoccaceae bacterium K14]
MLKFLISPTDLAGVFSYALLRIWLGMRALLTGLEKFSGSIIQRQPLLDEFGEPDITGAMVEISKKTYGIDHYQGMPDVLLEKFQNEPLIPNWALNLFEGALGPFLILFGIAVLIGFAPRIMLFAQGLLYCSLSLGLILLNESGGVAWLGVHVIMVVAALQLVKYDRFSVLPNL